MIKKASTHLVIEASVVRESTAPVGPRDPGEVPSGDEGGGPEPWTSQAAGDLLPLPAAESAEIPGEAAGSGEAGTAAKSGSAGISPHDETAELATVRRRIEIDLSTGLIDLVREVLPGDSGVDLHLDNRSILLPGLIDKHVHAREDTTGAETYKESFTSAGHAAIHGGVTAFAEMPNNPVPPVDDASYLAKLELARRAPVDVLLYAGVGPKTRPLSRVVPYKCFMGPSIGDLFFRDEEQLREALSMYRGQYVMFHSEDPVILEASTGAPTHFERRPPEAEIEAIDLILRMSENYQFEPHIAHLTTAGGLELIRAARRRGQRVTTEVTPHHLYYDQDNAGSFQKPGFLQCNPPIRTRLDRIALLEALRSGDIDYLATDHAPHTLEEKERGISGVTHLDTFGPFLFWLRDQGLTWARIQEVAAAAPGRFLGRFLPDRYGRIAPGYVGSLTVLEQQRATIRRADLRTRAGWSPFEGVTFSGQVRHTIVRGRVYP